MTATLNLGKVDMTNNRIARRLGREDGAAAVEFALIAGVLSMLIFGMMEYGLFFLQSQSLKAGAREGARVAAVAGTRGDIKLALLSGAGTSLGASSPGNPYDCFYVRVGTGGNPPATPPSSCASPEVGSTKYCTQGASPSTLGQEVVVTIPTGSGTDYSALPSNTGVIDALQIDIPFLPHLNVHPSISGSFRCEQ